jgi:1-aminocyclopropane-1-carboxylate deaminase/D-cysteine desulfhydrase-like pyridoxal-dependent ACC family enzyme
MANGDSNLSRGPEAEQLAARLAAVPRYELAVKTPLQTMTRLSERLGRRILVKRDDLTGLALGGNKVRQAEFFIGDARASGADSLVAGGSYAHSNHARVLAAAARVAGLEPVILFRPDERSSSHDERGNALLTHLLASDVRFVDALRDAPDLDRRGEVEFRRGIFESEAERLRGEGRRPYVVLGSSIARGVMGYVAAALELHEQLRSLDVAPSKVFVTSLGATHAGLELGARLLGEEYEVVGVAYQPSDRANAESTVEALAAEAAKLLGLEIPPVTNVQTDVEEAGEGYGISTAQSRKALSLAATSDALILDPTYTAKGFAGLLRWVEEERVDRDETVVFVHTGGIPELLARTWKEL